jgi:outer membrane protein OmpA-like peptidoglycan-associated protein
MSPRACVFLGSLGASLLVASSALAQAAGGGVSTSAGVTADASGGKSTTPRILVDLHVGGMGEIDADPETESYGGALIGANFFYGPLQWLSLGLGYERMFLGRDDEVVDDGVARRTTRGAHAMWITGRFYPYENEDFAWFVDLAGAPVWQDLSVSETIPPPDVVTPSTALGTGCETGDTARFGMRGGTGFEFPLTSLVIMHAQIGLDHYRFGEEEIDACGTGGNPATYFVGRVGFALSTGREKIVDTDKDGIMDPDDACPTEPGLPNQDKTKHGCPIRDRDHDTVLDPVDACPDTPGAVQADPLKNGCPIPGDIDGDGIIDEVDACKTVAGVANPDPAKNGCPPDKDGDGIVDAQDACPDVAGVADADPTKNGCPPVLDADGDGINDPQDACPKEPGKPDPDPTKNGCPLVVVTDGEIVINEQVQFETNKAIIRPESKNLLDQVADVIKKNPQIKKIEVQGHTDNVGAKVHNQQLSQRRAESVKKALVERGIEAGRLTPKGYGMDKPIADNATDAGKQKNRRVQFIVLEKGAPGAAAAPAPAGGAPKAPASGAPAGGAPAPKPPEAPKAPAGGAPPAPKP